MSLVRNILFFWNIDNVFACMLESEIMATKF